VAGNSKFAPQNQSEYGVIAQKVAGQLAGNFLL
jgi:hypothetical protein